MAVLNGGIPGLLDSERRILGLLFRKGEVTQGDLSAAFELSQQSISRLIGGLIEKGMVVTGGKISGAKGYRTTAIRLDGRHGTAAGFSITAGTVAMAMMNFAGEIIGEDEVHLRTMTVKEVAHWMAGRLGAMRGCVGVGLSVAGSFIDARTFNTPSYLEDWAGIDIEAVLGETLAMPVWADNDGNAATLAEGLLGVGREAPSFAYLYLSAGVGGGVMLDGELWRGRTGNAGEFAGGLPPNVYPFPNLELLRQLVGRDGHLFETVNDMVAHYDPAWPAIADWIERVRDSVSIIASNATAILDLDAIVLGGLIPRDLALRLIERTELFDQRRRAIPRPIARLVPSAISGNAAAIGAAMLPLRATYFMPASARGGSAAR